MVDILGYSGTVWYPGVRGYSYAGAWLVIVDILGLTRIVWVSLDAHSTGHEWCWLLSY